VAETIAGHGVYRSVNGGQDWTTSPDPPVGGIKLDGLQFDAIAAHPTDANTAWVVGDSGVYRTTNGGQGWTRFSRLPFTDVAFSEDSGGRPVLFLVPWQGIAHRAYVLRIDPDRLDAAILVDLPAAGDPPAAVRSTMPAHPAATPPDPRQGKIAISLSNPQWHTSVRDVSRRPPWRVPSPGCAGRRANRSWRRLADHPDFGAERRVATTHPRRQP
jgi:hypothetical protein